MFHEFTEMFVREFHLITASSWIKVV